MIHRTEHLLLHYMYRQLPRAAHREPARFLGISHRNKGFPHVVVYYSVYAGSKYGFLFLATLRSKDHVAKLGESFPHQVKDVIQAVVIKSLEECFTHHD